MACHLQPPAFPRRCHIGSPTPRPFSPLVITTGPGKKPGCDNTTCMLHVYGIGWHLAAFFILAFSYLQQILARLHMVFYPLLTGVADQGHIMINCNFGYNGVAINNNNII